MSTPSPRLDQTLPSDVVSRNAGGLMSYRNFPCFSLPWLRRRCALFGVIFGLFFVLITMGMLLATKDIKLSLTLGGLTFLAFMLMSSGGPALATWVRHRGWPQRRERIGVVLALLFGVAVSYGIDATVSRRVEREYIEPSMKAAGLLTDEMRKAAKPAPGLRAINFVFLCGIYGLLGGGLALRAYFGETRRWQEYLQAMEVADLRQRQQSAELRLGVLQAQIEPHFLFNTLASLRALVRQDAGRAEATIDALVDHLRATIPKFRESNGSFQSTLSQQFEICRSYLALMQVRMGDRLSFVLELPEALGAVPFPPLMLISLVENAVKHGIEPRPGPGHIRLHAERTQRAGLAAIRVEVSDDGRGLREGGSSGIGLANIRDQLQTRFQDSAELEIFGLAAGGTCAAITIPEVSA